MESTSGTPHLLTDVRFTVARKGYDPDEVDNFLERVSAAVAQLQEKLRQATANAEAAEGRATEATRAQTLLQARVDRLEADLAAAQSAAPAAAPVRSPEDDAAEVSKVLVLAQRTADAAVAEARATATQTVSEADAEASRILATARTEADEAATRQREGLAAEVRSLEESRAKLAGDIAALDRYLDDQRSSLSGALDRIRAVLDDPASLRLASAPATSAVDVPVAEEPVSEPEPTPIAVVTEPEPEPEPEPDLIDSAESDAELEPIIAAEPDVEPEVADRPAANLFGGGDPTPATPHVGPPTAPIAVFDAEAVEAEERYLDNGGDEESDEAMRRFFEADFDDDQRFGR
jgi:cell division initiation protein